MKRIALGLALGLAALVAAPLASRAEAAKSPTCFSASREGHCIVLQVNGQTSARLSKKSKKALKEAGQLSWQGEEARYELAAPVRGELDLKAKFGTDSAAYFGPVRDVIAHVLPLDGQSLETQRELSTAHGVQVGGAAAVTASDVLTENRLRPGRYLLSVRLLGASNWDRQVVFFEVAE